MPRMDGLTFLRKIMAEDPIPTVICSGVAVRGTEAALRALDEGAVGIVTKPKLGVRNFLYESGLVLTDMLRLAASARIRRRYSPPISPGRDASVQQRRAPTVEFSSKRLVAIGASTGGTEALTEILTAMPPDSPGIVVVQHMPEVFTAAFAQRLNGLSQIEVKEAENGDRVTAGRALIAPGNQHMTVRRRGTYSVVELDDRPLVSRHRPSVDVLFRSVAQAEGANALGIILTGMGNDGAQGLLEMKKSGAETVAQGRGLLRGFRNAQRGYRMQCCRPVSSAIKNISQNLDAGLEARPDALCRHGPVRERDLTRALTARLRAVQKHQ